MSRQSQALNRKTLNDLDISDLGAPDTMRYNVLTFVVNEEYDRSISYLKDFLDRDSEYPNFKDRVERYVQHSIDLIFAIRTKRNFPGLSLLTKSKQSELKERYRDHFQELKAVLRKIESCQEELRLTDIKSTTVFIKALCFSTVIVVISAFIIEVFQGLGKTFFTVFDDTLDKLIELIFSLI